MRPDHGGMHAGGLCSQRCQDGRWARGGLYPTHYRRYATTTAGHQGFAANRPTGRDGVQAAKSELRKGRRGEPADGETVGHVEVPVSRRNGVCARAFLRATQTETLAYVRSAGLDYATACAFRALDELTAAYRLRAMMVRDCCSESIAKHKPNHQN
jgi:hypothetical protein